MSETQKSADMESLARMAARLVGCNPDEHVTIQLGVMPAFDDVLWKYPDFLARAEAAYNELAGPAVASAQCSP